MYCLHFVSIKFYCCSRTELFTFWSIERFNHVLEMLKFILRLHIHVCVVKTSHKNWKNKQKKINQNKNRQTATANEMKWNNKCNTKQKWHEKNHLELHAAAHIHQNRAPIKVCVCPIVLYKWESSDVLHTYTVCETSIPRSVYSLRFFWFVLIVQFYSVWDNNSNTVKAKEKKMSVKKTGAKCKRSNTVLKSLLIVGAVSLFFFFRCH